MRDDAIVHYTIDSEDIIRYVSPSWDKFAMKNADFVINRTALSPKAHRPSVSVIRP